MISDICESIKGIPVYKNQLIRSSSSIGANIHEAKYAQSRADFINKLEIALKECSETEYWIELLFRKDILYVDEKKYNLDEKTFAHHIWCLRMNHKWLVENGMYAKFDEEQATDIMKANVVIALADIKSGDASATAWGCDLTYDYVKINADYRS